MDIIDHAAQLDEFHREHALMAVLSPRRLPAETPLMIDSVRCYFDCEEPIPEARLACMPNAVRCTACQERQERTGR